MRTRFWLIYLLILAADILLGNFLNAGPWICITLLPVLVLCLPVGYGGPAAMGIAFATAFAADFFTHGILGLNVMALLPAAFSHRWIISLVFGSEVYARGEDLSLRRQGLPKMMLALLISTALFFAVYVWVDAAGTRSFGFNTLRWLASTLASTLVQGFLTGFLSSDN